MEEKLKKLGESNHKFLRWVNKHFYYVIPAFLSLLILLATYIALGIFPFGKNGIQIIDSYHQYAPFFAELRDKLLNGESLFYSFSGGMGMNFWAVIAYYLASPLNLLIVLFPRGLVLEGFTVILMIKICLSSMTFSHYLQKSGRRINYSIVVFSLFYAFNGWLIGYNWNIMWVDCMMLLPLIVLGLERLIKTGKGWFYGIMLGLCIITNYYISIMVCIFLALYFFVYFFSQKNISAKLFIQRGLKFAGYSILAGALAAVLLVPAYCSLLTTYSANSSFPKEIKFDSNLWDMLSRHFVAVIPTKLKGEPNLYCGAIILLLIVLYIFHRGIRQREKILKISLLAFLLLSCTLKQLDYIWHGFHFPNDLPNRFTFVYIFVILAMGYDVFSYLHKFKYREYLIAFITTSLLILLSYPFTKVKHEVYTYIAVMAVVCVYFILMSMMNMEFKRRKLYHLIIVLVMAVEVIGNTVFGLLTNGKINRNIYNQDLENAKKVSDEVEAREVDFYRMEIESFAGRNNVIWLGYRGLSLFSSTNLATMNTLFEDLGLYGAANKYSYVGSTPLVDSIFGVKYVVSKQVLSNVRNLEEAFVIDNHHVYRNKNALSVGFMVPSDYLEWNYKDQDAYEIQNDFILKTAGITAPLYTRLKTPEPTAVGCEITENGERVHKIKKIEDKFYLEYELELTEEKDLYLEFSARDCENIQVFVDGNIVRSSGEMKGHIVQIGQVGPENEVKIKVNGKAEKTTATVDLIVFEHHQDVLNDFYDQVSDEQWTVNTVEDGHLKGVIEVKEAGILYTSIPYDKGWTIKVDGKEVPIVSTNECFLSIELSEGNHEIEMTYVPEGFKIGLILSVTSLAIFIIIAVKTKKQGEKQQKDKK